MTLLFWTPIGFGSLSSQNSNNVAITGGSISLNMGAGTGTGKPLLRYNTQTTQVGNVGAGEDDLMSVTIPISSLSSSGKELLIEAFGIATNNSNPKTVKAYINSTAILSFALATSLASQNWSAKLKIISTGTDTQLVWAEGHHESSTTSDIVVMSLTAPTEDDGATITIKFTATVTDGGGGINNNDVTQNYMSTDFAN